MARTREEIFQDITGEASQYIELGELEANTSKVSFWRYCKEVIAFVVWTLEGLFDRHKAEVQTLIDTTEIGTESWYVGKVLAYQYGEPVVYINNVLSYPDTSSAEAEAKKIIKKVSIVEKSEGGLLFKVLKSGNGLLDYNELDGLSVYLTKVKIIGTPIEIRSAEAVKMKLVMEVELDAQVFNADGTRKSDSVKAVEQAVTDYLSSMPFDGVFFVSKLEDAIQAVVGVVDVSITATQYLNGSTWTDTGRKFNPSSGWMETTFSGTNSSQINYVIA